MNAFELFMAGTAPLRGAQVMIMSATEWRGPSEDDRT
jgi:hypothetical protein